MVKVNYRQEQVRASNFVISGIFILAGILTIADGYRSRGGVSLFEVEEFYTGSGLILFVVVFTIIAVRKAFQIRDEVVRLKKQGQKIDGQILQMNTHVHTDRHQDGIYHESYSYSFSVKYMDPFSGVEKTGESIRTFQYYQLKGHDCTLRVLDDLILVEEIDAKEIQAKWSKLDLILLFSGLGVITALLLSIIIPLLGTL